MKLTCERITEFLKDLPYAKISSDGRQLMCRCPFCGDSRKDPTHTNFSIKLAREVGEAFLYKCFRAECGRSGLLTTDTLQLFGCRDMDTLSELATWNQAISKKFDKQFHVKKSRQYQVVNVKSDYSKGKLAYINQRLGTNWDFKDLKDYRIQLNLYDFIRGNRIRKLAYSKTTCDNLDAYCIGFISMYQDYAIFRDCTKNMITGKRYYNYRTSGEIDPNDTKVYCIPTELDLLDPNPADINIAEGAFSILGAYLHTDYGRDNPNSLFLANCGSEYRNTILSVCAQYGLVKINLHLWADSEIPIGKFQKLYKSIKDRLLIEHCYVYYNTKAEDFGQRAKNISVKRVILK